MKYFLRTIHLIMILITGNLCAQEDVFNTHRGRAVDGYDVTAYFEHKTVKGLAVHAIQYQGVTYHFANSENRDRFKANPEQFIPQYGGYCAYALGAKNKKVDIDPETYEIRDGKLYLFYNNFGINTLEKWLNENPEEILHKADKNWKKIIANKQ